MKYLSLIVVIAFIAFTFWFSKRTEDLTIDQMNKMNRMITQYMTQSIKKQQPEATDIDFSKIYTEVIENGRKMKAHFKFSYMEPNAQGELVKVYRKGHFLIVSEDGNQWTAQIEQAGDVKVEFMEAFDVTNSQPNADTVPGEEGPSEDSNSADESEEEG